MKRYVYEFANDMTKRLENAKKGNPLAGEIVSLKIAGVKAFVLACNNGLITDFEAVRTIVSIMECETVGECWFADYHIVKNYRKEVK